jgi:NAD+ synthase
VEHAEKMNSKQRINCIVKWLQQYSRSANMNTFVVGISGGIDSSVVSALCAQSGIRTIAVQLPIRQNRALDAASSLQATWLLEHYPATVTHTSLDLTTVFSAFEKKLVPVCGQENNSQTALALANSRSRLRMMALYQIAQSHSGLVVGTGNRVEDFGVGFFTKYGDGGVDISPIGDCLKTHVWAMGQELGLPQAIIDAAPTDGLWDDGRTDQDQLGMTYSELERAMSNDLLENADIYGLMDTSFTPEERQQITHYRALRRRNMHKMQPIPVCTFDK